MQLNIKTIFLSFVTIIFSCQTSRAQGYYSSLKEVILKMESLKMDEAWSQVEKLQPENQDKWEIYYLKAQLNYNKKAYGEAFDMINTALEKNNPDYIACHLLKGIIEMYRQNTANAYDEFNSVLVELSNPSNKNYYNYSKVLNLSRNNRGLCALKLGRYLNAKTDYDSLFANNIPLSNDLFNWGYAHWKTGSYNQSEKNAQKILEWNNLKTSIEIGKSASDFVYDTLWRRNSIKEALQDYDKGLKQFYTIEDIEEGNKHLKKLFDGLVKAWKIALPVPDQLDIKLRDSIRNQFAFVTTLLKDIPEMSEDAREHVVQANIYNEDKKYYEAINAYSKAIAVCPWYANGYYNRALLKAMVNSYQAAIADMELYIKLAPSSPDARAAKDKIYEWKLRGTESQSNNNGSTPKAETIHTLFLWNWIHLKEVAKYNRIYFSAGACITGAFQLGKINIPSELDLFSTILFHYRLEAEVYPLKKLGIGVITGGINGLSGADDKITITQRYNGVFADIFLMKKEKMKSQKVSEIAFFRFATGKARLYGSGIEKDFSEYTFDQSKQFSEIGFGFGARMGRLYVHDYFGAYLCNFGDMRYNIISSPIPFKVGDNIPWMMGTKTKYPVHMNYSRFLISFTLGFYF